MPAMPRVDQEESRKAVYIPPSLARPVLFSGILMWHYQDSCVLLESNIQAAEVE